MYAIVADIGKRYSVLYKHPESFPDDPVIQARLYETPHKPIGTEATVVSAWPYYNDVTLLALEVGEAGLYVIDLKGVEIIYEPGDTVYVARRDWISPEIQKCKVSRFLGYDAANIYGNLHLDDGRWYHVDSNTSDRAHIYLTYNGARQAILRQAQRDLDEVKRYIDAATKL